MTDAERQGFYQDRAMGFSAGGAAEELMRQRQAAAGQPMAAPPTAPPGPVAPAAPPMPQGWSVVNGEWKWTGGPVYSPELLAMTRRAPETVRPIAPPAGAGGAVLPMSAADAANVELRRQQLGLLGRKQATEEQPERLRRTTEYRKRYDETVPSFALSVHAGTLSGRDQPTAEDTVQAANTANAVSQDVRIAEGQGYGNEIREAIAGSRFMAAISATLTRYGQVLKGTPYIASLEAIMRAAGLQPPAPVPTQAEEPYGLPPGWF